jgi:hypothetical protein
VDELGSKVIGRLILKQIAKDAEEREAAFGPARFELAPTFRLACRQMPTSS